MNNSELALAKRLLEVIPPLMHRIRSEVRNAAGEELSIPQFRILANIHRGLKHVGLIAEHHGVSQPAMSKMVEGLVSRGLITRTTDQKDRRQIKLVLSRKGLALFEEVRRSTQARIAKRFNKIGKEEQRRLEEAFHQIESVLLDSQEEV